MRVLLVESSFCSTASIGADLKADSIQVEYAEPGDDAIYLMQIYDFDLVLLDSSLSDMDGSALISRIREAKHAIPIIALSANPQIHLQANGADDVIERSANQLELLARIDSVVRRSRGLCQAMLQASGLTLDVDQHNVSADGVCVQLTSREFALLQLLVLRRNMIMTKEMILAHLYSGMNQPEIKIIDVLILKIRTKLAKAGLPTLISTVWGRGYSVRDGGSDTYRTGRDRQLGIEHAFA